ncbi:MAG TPA: class I SAM-dependent rRNA methyltransferase [Chitinivibrionales bacterium]|jgi:23S rRNA (cytosine1962-C5)-methyltransferase|nr:class I SAM-dependent rRNA methyltransferase [Chitinivibrionales bacterium]
MLTVQLKNGKDKPIRMGHPWIFSGAIARVLGSGDNGELCTVVSSAGAGLGTGFYNGNSAIRVRMLAKQSETFDETVLARRIGDAVARRASILDDRTDSCRLVNSEGDRLPGLIVDKYADGLCVQVLTAGMERLRQPMVDSLVMACSPVFICERSDTDARSREGLPEKNGPMRGTLPEQVVMKENGLSFHVNLSTGQKTGFFLDQRDNRRLFASFAAGKALCDCFCYSGGFSVYGLSGGAVSSTMVDISETAVEAARDNCGRNGFGADRCTGVAANVFGFLRATERRFGCIVLDPPPFARHKGEVESAARGYKDINLLAFKNVEPGGIVFTFSCSNAIDPNLFRQIVFAAAADSQRFVQVLHVLSAGPDHPFNIAHREGEYLKGLVLRVE